MKNNGVHKRQKKPVFYERHCSCVPIVSQKNRFVNRFSIKNQSKLPKKEKDFDINRMNFAKKEKSQKNCPKGIDKWKIVVYNDGIKAKVSL